MTNAITAAIFFELGGDLLSNARELPVQAPSIATVLRGPSILTMAGGVDVPALRRLTKDLADRTRQLGEVCMQDDLRDLGDKLDSKLAPLAAGPVASLTAFAIALHAYEPSPDGGKMPKKVDAVGVVTSTDARALYAQLAAMIPQINMLGLVPDGALHEILAGTGVAPFSLFAGVGPKTILLAAGDDERDRAERALDDNLLRPVPFLVVDYDYAKFEQLQRGLGLESKTNDRAMTDQLIRHFGRGNFTLSLEDDSLAAWTSIELK